MEGKEGHPKEFERIDRTKNWIVVNLAAGA